jgi:large subunit ribosomal protein L31e
MVEKQTLKIEREYTIPLREKCRPVPRYKKTPKAVKTVKEFVARHMKIENRDLKKVKIDSYLNEQLWLRGIKKTLHKVKVKVVKEGEIIRVYAVDLPSKLNFKKIRNEKKTKNEKEAAEKFKESQKSMIEKAKDQVKSKPKESDANKDGVEDIVEKEEKDKSKEKLDQKEMKEDSRKIKKTTNMKRTGENLDEVQKSD